jgi:hypothetical protein
MNRRLVLSNEDAGHPFRRTMPAEALRLLPEEMPKPLKWWQTEDTHLFVLSFGAFFTVFYTFIA